MKRLYLKDSHGNQTEIGKHVEVKAESSWNRSRILRDIFVGIAAGLTVSVVGYALPLLSAEDSRRFASPPPVTAPAPALPEVDDLVTPRLGERRRRKRQFTRCA